MSNAKEFGKVSWSWEDVETLKPEWTKEKCRKFLQRYENGIQEAMLEAGWHAIEIALESY